MKCVILQPSYIPWRGYFHQIYKADIFVFYDDVQYDKHGWRNRNRIKTPNGSHWLTIPVLTKGLLTNGTPINQVCIDWKDNWARKHWSTIKLNYGKAPYFLKYEPIIEKYYNNHPKSLSDFTIELTMALAKEIGIEKTRFVRSSSLHAKGKKTERLLSILQQLDVTHYISGPSAKDYLDEDMLRSAEISIEYMEYKYPEYRQLYPPFDPNVSILDLLFMAGPQASQYIW